MTGHVILKLEQGYGDKYKNSRDKWELTYMSIILLWKIPTSHILVPNGPFFFIPTFIEENVLSA